MVSILSYNVIADTDQKRHSGFSSFREAKIKRVKRLKGFTRFLTFVMKFHYMGASLRFG